MGMSHLALATQYVGKRNLALCDTKLSTRVLFRLLGYKTFKNVDVAASAVDRLEGVLIATPTPSHAHLAKWAIKKGVPCFVEKPLTLDVNASTELKLLAAAKGVNVQVGFVLRYVASFQRIRHLISSQSLGAVLDYTASMRGNVIFKSPSPDSWQGNFKKGGGCLNEYGPHIIDLCQFIFGKVDNLGDVRMNRVFCMNADDQIDFTWSHHNGCKGKVEIDWCDTTKRKSVVEFKVKFEHAEVRVDNSAVEIIWNEGCTICADLRHKIDAPIRPSNVAYYLRGEEFSLELEEFLGTCIGRRLSVEDTLPVDITARLDDGCEVDRLIDEIAGKAGLK
jgi:scyllo-inositol 2-dehydrogenase (NADP+)